MTEDQPIIYILDDDHRVRADHGHDYHEAQEAAREKPDEQRRR